MSGEVSDVSDRFLIQGNVPLFEIPSVPKGAQPVQDRRIALGEVTGHAHTVEGDVAVFRLDDGLYLSVGAEGAVVTHEEHGVMPIAPGTWRVGHQREYDAFEAAARQVVD